VRAGSHTTYRAVDTGHGRLEVRTTTVIDDPALLTGLHPDEAVAAPAWSHMP